jgi:hypothetical protein
LRAWTDADHADALTSLALGLWQRGETNSARSLAEKVYQLTQGRIDQDRHGDALMAFAETTAASGDVPRTEALARALTPAASTGAVLILARVISARGDLDLAEKLVERLHRPEDKAEILTALARRAHVSNEHDRLRRLAACATSSLADASHPHGAQRAAPALIAVVALTGDVDRVHELLATVAKEEQRLSVLTTVVEALGRRGDIDQAQTLIPTISDDYRRAHTIVALATGVASTGDTTTATRILEDIPQTTIRNDGFSQVAQAAAAAGYPDRADTVVEHIEDAPTRSKALVALADKAERPRKQRLLAKAVQANGWSRAAATLAADGASAVPGIIDIFVELTTSPRPIT